MLNAALKGGKEALGEDDGEKVGQCCVLECRCVRLHVSVMKTFSLVVELQMKSTQKLWSFLIVH